MLGLGEKKAVITNKSDSFLLPVGVLYATEAEYAALDWDSKVPLDAVGPYEVHPVDPPASGVGASPKPPHTEGDSDSRR